MSQPRFVGEATLERLLTMEQAIDALDAAFASTLPDAPPRSHLDVGGADLLLMPAWSARAAGVKLVTVAPENPKHDLPLIHGIYALFDKPTLQPIVLFDAAPLTALRTAAVSGVATRHLARSDARDLVLLGAGTQARAHLDAMAVVRPIATVAVVSRSQPPVQELVRRARELGFNARAGSADDVACADIVCTCTTSTEPVFDGSLLKPGVHVNAVGSYKPTSRELDDAALRGALVTVDADTALEESGDLVIPLESGVIRRDRVRLLADVVVNGRGSASSREKTIFKSVGAAFEDLVIAEAAAARL